MPSRSWKHYCQRNVLLPALMGIALVLAATNAYAHDRVARVHASAHSAGSAASIRVTESRKSASRHKSNEESASRSGSRSSRNAVKASKAQPSSAKSKSRSSGPKGRREQQIDDNPIILHRAKSRASRQGVAKEREYADIRSSRESKRSLRGRAIARYEEPSASARARRESVEPPHAIILARNTAPLSPTAPVRNLTATPRGFIATGQSHPVDDGDVSGVDVTTDSASVGRSKIPSVVIRSQVAPEAEVSANDGPASKPLPQSRVVNGFGAEVAARTPAPVSSIRDVTADDEAVRQFSVGNNSSARTLAESAEQPMVLPEYTRDGKLIMPAPLKGSHEILVHQNTMADRDGLERIQNDRELDRLLDLHLLVGFPETSGLRVNPTLPENRRAARPWTVKFAADTARAFYSKFGESLFVTSAVRTVSYQIRLQRVNGNAAAIDGDGASPHLTGQAIDFAKRGMTSEELAWMRTYLMPLIEAGKIDVEEEFQQACFHVSVYRAYSPVQHRRNVQVAQVQPESKSTEPLPVPVVRMGDDLNDR